MKDADRHTKAPLPIACGLSTPDLAKRRRDLAGDVFGHALQLSELKDGYEFSFPGDAGWATRLAAFVDAERACCPFFTFELRFEPHGGRISLGVRGPEGTKEFVKAELLEAGLPSTSAKTEG